MYIQISTLVIAQPKGCQIGPEALSAVSAAKEIGGDLTILLAGSKLGPVSQYASKISGVSQVTSRADCETRL
jgi:electron transfer flavoprotein alpha subunit